jgi:hypothetical protein
MPATTLVEPGSTRILGDAGTGLPAGRDDPERPAPHRNGTRLRAPGSGFETLQMVDTVGKNSNRGRDQPRVPAARG